jgi:hypothetical protein
MRAAYSSQQGQSDGCSARASASRSRSSVVSAFSCRRLWLFISSSTSSASCVVVRRIVVSCAGNVTTVSSFAAASTSARIRMLTVSDSTNVSGDRASAALHMAFSSSPSPFVAVDEVWRPTTKSLHVAGAHSCQQSVRPLGPTQQQLYITNTDMRAQQHLDGHGVSCIHDDAQRRPHTKSVWRCALHFEQHGCTRS